MFFSIKLCKTFVAPLECCRLNCTMRYNCRCCLLHSIFLYSLRLIIVLSPPSSLLWHLMGTLSFKMGEITILGIWSGEQNQCLYLAAILQCLWRTVCRLICTKRHNCRYCPVHISLLFETHRSLRDSEPFFWFYRSLSIIPPSIPSSLFWPLMGALSRGANSIFALGRNTSMSLENCLLSASN